MVADVLPTVNSLFIKIIQLFDRVFTSFGAWGFFFSAFIIFTSYRLLLRPIMGAYVSAGASDTVKKIRQKDKKGN